MGTLTLDHLKKVMAEMEKRFPKDQMLAKIKASAITIQHLKAFLPHSDHDLTLTGVPIFEDEDIPWGHVEMEYLSGRTERIKIAKVPRFEVGPIVQGDL